MPFLNRSRYGAGVLLGSALAVAIVAATVVASPAQSARTKSTTKPKSKSTTARTTTRPKTASKPTAGVTALRVTSTGTEYFVVSVQPDLVEYPVAIVKGVAGETVITDRRRQLPADRYRVATVPIDKPGDADGDGVNDLVELADPKANPLNPAKPVDPEEGVINIPDKATFERLSYQGDEVLRDGYLAGREFVKFWIVKTDTNRPEIYFMNTEVHRGHFSFGPVIGLEGRGPRAGTMRGDIVFNPKGKAADGSTGTYRFAFQPNDAFSFPEVAMAYELLMSAMPLLQNNLSYYPHEGAGMAVYEADKARFDAYRVPVLLKDL
jgi:hypothetical protein